MFSVKLALIQRFPPNSPSDTCEYSEGFNFKYVQVIVDAFSGVIYVDPGNTNNAENATAALQKCLQEAQQKYQPTTPIYPNAIFTDHGTKYENFIYQKYVTEKLHARHVFLSSSSKAFKYLRIICWYLNRSDMHARVIYQD